MCHRIQALNRPCSMNHSQHALSSMVSSLARLQSGSRASGYHWGRSPRQQQVSCLRSGLRPNLPVEIVWVQLSGNMMTVAGSWIWLRGWAVGHPWGLQGGERT